MHAPTINTRRGKRIAIAGLVLAFSFAMTAPSVFGLFDGPSPSNVAPSDAGTTYGGRAYGVWTHVPFVGDASYADTGDLSAEGGALFADFTLVDSSVASATVFLSYVRGFVDVTRTEVATADVVLLPGTATEVAAGFVYAGSTATCDGVSGASEVFDLTVADVPVYVTGEPNQVYSIPGVLTLVINEQIGSSDSMTVNALHLTTVAGVEAIVSGARSEVACGGDSGSSSLLPLGVRSSTTEMRTYSVGDRVSPMCGYPGCDKEVPDDFVTGGGWFAPPNSNRPGRVNFGFNAGPRPGNPEIKGHLNLIDHDSGQHLKGVNVDTYTRNSVDPDNCRDFAGDGTLDGVSGRYSAVVCDYGEPGRNDRFVVLFVVGEDIVYFADNFDGSPSPMGGALDGGNIQLHAFRA